jgi:hypothetical protein
MTVSTSQIGSDAWLHTLKWDHPILLELLKWCRRPLKRLDETDFLHLLVFACIQHVAKSKKVYAWGNKSLSTVVRTQNKRWSKMPAKKSPINTFQKCCLEIIKAARTVKSVSTTAMFMMRYECTPSSGLPKTLLKGHKGDDMHVALYFYFQTDRRIGFRLDIRNRSQQTVCLVLVKVEHLHILFKLRTGHG